MDYFAKSLELHAKLKGKISVESKVKISSRDDLSLAYTPGVAQPCKEIAAHPEKVYEYTMKGNCVAVVSDGSAVLGLGNIGAAAAIPVMEGKAVLFKQFAGIDAFPICVKTQDAKEIVELVKNIAPVFGGINLEDIAAPKCFEVEEALLDIGIPVMHDDQHGTAIVVLAALRNASKVVGKEFAQLRVAISGAGAAGAAIARMLLPPQGRGERVAQVVMVDSKGIIFKGREGLDSSKKMLAEFTNPSRMNGSLADALVGADVFIGVSAAGIVTSQMVSKMGKDAIVLAMANPTPEIMPEAARKGGARVIATGRSDFPNQVNNALAFPGVFRGALDAKATVLNSEMKLAAAQAIAACVAKPSREEIVPSVLDARVVPAVAKAVAAAARKAGVVRE